MIKVSVIVPVYNMEKYIERCLDSLINQTLKDMEIIVINDGSTDNSKEIIKKYLPKIQYYEKKNGGLSSARNYGMNFAKGEYIAFLDSDDYVEVNMYEEMYNKAKQDKADMVECDFIWEWKNRVKKDKRRNNKNKKQMMKKPRVVAWNRITKREKIAKFPEGLIYEDLEFFYKTIPYLNKISYINKYFVHYTQREDSISNTQNEKNADIFKIIDNIFGFYLENNLYDEYKKELNFMKKRILFGSSMKRILKIKDKNLKRKLILKTIKYVKNNFQNFNKPRICFGITNLQIGGAERVLVDLVNKLEKIYDITIFTIYSGGELEKELKSNIKVVSLIKSAQKDAIKKDGVLPLKIMIFSRWIYKKYLKGKYNVCIAFLEGPITRIFSYARDIAWVHNDIKKVYGDSFKAKIKLFIDKHFYKKYKRIIFVSKQNKKSFEELYGDISERKVIYNYIDKDRIWKLSNQYSPTELQDKPNDIPKIITVARLVKQKGIDRFIRIHKKLINHGLFHKVFVIGEGEERESLLKLVKELNVKDTFIFLGKKENPYPYIKQADYFALLSYYEGYGMVLEEAKILNKKIIITDTAAKEAVQNYEKAIVLPNNEESILDGLEKVIQYFKKRTVPNIKFQF